jgi:hypothetical protein
MGNIALQKEPVPLLPLQKKCASPVSKIQLLKMMGSLILIIPPLPLSISITVAVMRQKNTPSRNLLNNRSAAIKREAVPSMGHAYLQTPSFKIQV